jgi:transposase, IS5 family
MMRREMKTANGGHNAPPDHRFKVYISGQKRRVTNTSSESCDDGSAVEPVIGHAKGEHRMGRNYLAIQQGDAINAVLAAGYNFRRLLAWLALLLFAFLFAMVRPAALRNQSVAV